MRVSDCLLDPGALALEERAGRIGDHGFCEAADVEDLMLSVRVYDEGIDGIELNIASAWTDACGCASVGEPPVGTIPAAW